jgi:hypothetical protein
VPRFDVPRPVAKQLVANLDGSFHLSAAQRRGRTL